MGKPLGNTGKTRESTLETPRLAPGASQISAVSSEAGQRDLHQFPEILANFSRRRRTLPQAHASARTKKIPPERTREACQFTVRQPLLGWHGCRVQVCGHGNHTCGLAATIVVDRFDQRDTHQRHHRRER